MVPNSLTDSANRRPLFLHAVTILLFGCILAATTGAGFAQHIQSADANSSAESLTAALHALNARHRMAQPAEQADRVAECGLQFGVPLV